MVCKWCCYARACLVNIEVNKAIGTFIISFTGKLAYRPKTVLVTCFKLGNKLAVPPPNKQ